MTVTPAPRMWEGGPAWPPRTGRGAAYRPGRAQDIGRGSNWWGGRATGPLAAGGPAAWLARGLAGPAGQVAGRRASHPGPGGERGVVPGGGPPARPMGEDKRLVLSGGRSEGPEGGHGARLLRGPAAGDSDGMMGSGGESDSSEEIHYGPGFVSRLKSRYMSVALRGSARGSLGTLRRTASLEDFLELDKAQEAEEARLAAPPLARRAAPAPAPTQAASKRESMKRAQSVEVLSVLAEASPRQARAQAGQEPEPEEEEDTFYQSCGPPPEERPPPLPPREREAPVLGLLRSSPALVNTSLTVVDRSPAARTPPKAASPARPKAARPTANAKKSSQSRPSAGVLFGVKDKELPAPDTVKETRKLFESQTSGAGGRRFGSRTAGGLTKSKSTSSLYSRSPSRAGSQERGASSPSRRPSPRKAAGSVTYPGGRAAPLPAPRPSIPAKPSHLSPAARPAYRRASSGPQPPLPARAAGPGVVKATPAMVVPIHAPQAAASRPAAHKPRLEDGGRRISQESIKTIRSEGGLPSLRSAEPSGGKSQPPSSSPPEPKQVAALRPAGREWSRPGAAAPKVKKLLTENKSKTNNVLVSNLNKVNNNRGEDRTEPAPQKRPTERRTPRVDRAPVIVPPVTPTQAPIPSPPAGPAPAPPPAPPSAPPSAPHPAPPSAPHPAPPSAPSTPPIAPPTLPTLPPAAPVLIAAPVKAPAVVSAPPSVTPPAAAGPGPERLEAAAPRDPPTVPPRNGSKLEHGREGLQDTTDAAAVGPATSYRDAWKASKEQQNSLVFNFVGAKKDVSHIENDGLDLSSRAKAAGKAVILLETNGESCDGEQSPGAEEGQDLAWVGAGVRTGKSSLRSKPRTKKLNISFNDQPEVFEYPSFEPVSPTEPPAEEADQSRLKANTVVGSSGGLGSYTPSKIHMSDSPFLLGVSRRPAPAPAPAPSAAPALIPVDHGVSWGRAASSDMLF